MNEGQILNTKTRKTLHDPEDWRGGNNKAKIETNNNTKKKRITEIIVNKKSKCAEKNSKNLNFH